MQIPALLVNGLVPGFPHPKEGDGDSVCLMGLSRGLGELVQ
jgi:hypothetical protein